MSLKEKVKIRGHAMWPKILALIVFSSVAAGFASARPGDAAATQVGSENFGPYNLNVLEGGVGVQRLLAANAGLNASGAPWSMTTWILSVRRQPGTVIVAALGDTDPPSAEWRGIVLRDGELTLVVAPGLELRGGVGLPPGKWHHIAATYDGGTARLYLDGRECGALEARTSQVAARIDIAPAAPDAAAGSPHFGGSLAGLALRPFALDAQAVRLLADARPDFSLVTFDQVGVGWPLQEHAWRGLQAPQDPWTLPHSRSAPSLPHAAPVPSGAAGGLAAESPGLWTLDAWHLRAAPQVAEDGAVLSHPGYREREWMAAVVPGTVLTTLIARGVYPDPGFGLDNLGIPDSLSRQDYWYRSVFDAPAELRDREATLDVQRHQLCRRSVAQRRPRRRASAARSPAASSTSRACCDPGEPMRWRCASRRRRIRAFPTSSRSPPVPARMAGCWPSTDRPSSPPRDGTGSRAFATAIPGIWQNVELHATGALRLLDPHVMTQLAAAAHSTSADICDRGVPIENRRAATVRATLVARFETSRVRKTAANFRRAVTKSVSIRRNFRSCISRQPRLWWPNGYGAANLYTLDLEVDEARPAIGFARALRFGIREITYELSLFDHAGRLRRVEVDPTLGSQLGRALSTCATRPSSAPLKAGRRA